MSTTSHWPTQERIGLTVVEVAELLHVSTRHIWGLAATARMPQPKRLGRAVRWDRAEIEAWFAAGCGGEQLGGEVANVASKARCRGRSPRWRWVVTAVRAVMAVVFTVTASMVAADLSGWLGPWRRIVWVLCGISASFTIGAAVWAKRRAGPLEAVEVP